MDSFDYYNIYCIQYCMYNLRGLGFSRALPLLGAARAAVGAAGTTRAAFGAAGTARAVGAADGELAAWYLGPLDVQLPVLAQ